MADSGLLIDMRNVVKTYNEGEPSELTVLHGVDFYADQGEFVSIVGPSGCGKSTLMNLIGMLDRPTEGPTPSTASRSMPKRTKNSRPTAAKTSASFSRIST